MNWRGHPNDMLSHSALVHCQPIPNPTPLPMPELNSHSPITLIRGTFLDLVADPFQEPIAHSVRYIPDGLLVIENGIIQAFGHYTDLNSTYGHLPITTYSGQLIVPGLIDAHIHYPQSEMIAAYGEQLLEWLEKYTFPTEAKFQNPDHARQIAAFCLDELLRNGTTTAVILPTIFPESVQILFEEAERRRMRVIAGQVLMSRNAPSYLVNDAPTALAETREQIQHWHGRGRSLYAITPRFAATSTEEELKLAGQLRVEFPQVYIHTHLSENRKELALIRELFPHATDYLHVYEHHGLVGNRSIFAHCIHLSDSELQRFAQSGAMIAYCPLSNLFLGSGLFKLHQAKSQPFHIPIGLATDVGGGTSFSLLKTMAAAYTIAQLQEQTISPFQMMYLATLGSAKALGLQEQLGNFQPGKEADFVVFDTQATPLMKLRNPHVPAQSLDELSSQLFALIILGDDRAVAATYVNGSLIYQQ